MRQFVATKAFIEHEGKILLLKESSKYEEGANAGRHDVVGGRVEPGQHFLESLRREIEEETGLKNVVIGQPFHTDEWRPTVNGEQWQIIGTYFKCTAPTNQVTLSKDHSEFVWINPQDHTALQLIPGLEKAFAVFLKTN